MFILLSCGGDTAWAHVHRGNSAYARADYPRALTEYDHARSQRPADGRIGYDQANALLQLGRLDDARTAAASALSANDDPLLSRRARYTIGSAAFAGGAYDVARDAFVAVLLDDGTDRDAKRNLELTLRALQVPPAQPTATQTPPSPTTPDANAPDDTTPPVTDGGSSERPGTSVRCRAHWARRSPPRLPIPAGVHARRQRPNYRPRLMPCAGRI
jgi:tetratricopeptide (TPR) repeat protein